MKTTLIWIASLLCLHTAFAQSGPYSMFGHEGKVLDLSDVVGEGLKITAADSQAVYAVYAEMNPRLHLFSIHDGTGAMIRQDSISLTGYARWMSVDPARQFASPYVGMGNNPVSGVDRDGRRTSPIYNSDGNYLGTDSKGFAGEILIFDDPSQFIQGMDHAKALSIGKGINQAGLSFEAASNVFTHIVSRMPEINMSLLHNGKISMFGTYDYRNTSKIYNNALVGMTDGPANTGVRGIHYLGDASGTGNIKVSVNWIMNKNPILNTVENVQNMLGVHEFLGHGVHRFAIDPNKPHTGAYLMQFSHPTYFFTTPVFQNHMESNFNDMTGQ